MENGRGAAGSLNQVLVEFFFVFWTAESSEVKAKIRIGTTFVPLMRNFFAIFIGQDVLKFSWS